MPEIWAGQLGGFRGITTAGGGTALTTTASYLQFPALSVAGDSKRCHLFVTPRNFSTAVVAQIAFNPWLTVLKTTDNMVKPPTDYSIEAQDNSTSTSVTLSDLGTVANGDWLLVGSHVPFGGVSLDIDGTNGTGGVTLTVDYMHGGDWSNLSLSYSVGWTTAFDADTVITWTPPANWQARAFKDLYPAHIGSYYYSNVPLYWTRWSVDVAVDSSTTIDAMLATNALGAVYGELISGQVLEQRAKYGFGGLGNIAALTDAGTANLIANISAEKDGEL